MFYCFNCASMFHGRDLGFMETFVRPRPLALASIFVRRGLGSPQPSDFPRWQHGSEITGGLDAWPDRVAELSPSNSRSLKNWPWTSLRRAHAYAGLDKDSMFDHERAEGAVIPGVPSDAHMARNARPRLKVGLVGLIIDHMPDVTPTIAMMRKAKNALCPSSP